MSPNDRFDLILVCWMAGAFFVLVGCVLGQALSRRRFEREFQERQRRAAGSGE